MLMIQTRKVNYNAKISEIVKKHFATFDYNKFMNILDPKITKKVS